jgi:hypothetical protein
MQAQTALLLFRTLFKIANVGSDDSSGLYGGGIFIKKGLYKCITTISVNSAILNLRQGMTLTREGRGTVLYWQPSSELNFGILVNQNNATISNMTLRANANLSYLVYGIATVEIYWMNLRILHCSFEGPNAYPYGTMAPVTGQIGIIQDGNAVAQPYWWKIIGCTFLSLDYGIFSFGANATSMQISSCDSLEL